MITITLTDQDALDYLNNKQPAPVQPTNQSPDYSYIHSEWTSLVDSGIKPPPTRDTWTEPADTLISMAIDNTSNYYTVSTLSAYLGRSVAAIRARANIKWNASVRGDHIVSK